MIYPITVKRLYQKLLEKNILVTDEFDAPLEVTTYVPDGDVLKELNDDGEPIDEILILQNREGDIMFTIYNVDITGNTDNGVITIKKGDESINIRLFNLIPVIL